MNSFIFDKFSEIKPKEYSYDFSKSKEQRHWDIYYRHRFKRNGRTYYATMLGTQTHPTAYIAVEEKYIETTTLIKILEKEYDYFNNNGIFTQEFTYYKRRNNKIILGWDYRHGKDYSEDNLTGEKHTTESVIADIKQTIKEVDDFLFTSTPNKQGLEKLKSDYFDSVVKEIKNSLDYGNEPFMLTKPNKDISIYNGGNFFIIKDGKKYMLALHAYFENQAVHFPYCFVFFEDTKTDLADGIYYKGFKVSDL